MGEIGANYAVAEPGVYYRDFEKATLASVGKILPSYPASREYCAMGGIVSNNSGGELTLRYGKTNKYVRELEVVLSDGSQARVQPLTMGELQVAVSDGTRTVVVVSVVAHGRWLKRHQPDRRNSQSLQVIEPSH